MASGGSAGPSYSAVVSGSAAYSDTYPGRSLPHTRPLLARQSSEVSRRHQDHIDVMALEQPFFIPSYLRGSRHAERLEEAYKSKLSGRDGKKSSPSSNGGSLSTSSSSANLHKMVPSHRGMTHEIVERIPTYIEEPPIPPLPSRWNELDKHTDLSIQTADALEIKLTSMLKSSSDEGAAVRADHPMPRQCGIYYYEVTINSKSKECLIAVGFMVKKTPLNRLPGWEPESWAYHGDDGNSFCCQQTGKQYSLKFSNNDVVGCGVNFRTKTAFFTRNGVDCGIAFKDIPTEQLYPAIGVKKPGETIRANFGQSPFVFDIDLIMEQEKADIRDQVNSTSLGLLARSNQGELTSSDETSLIKRLVRQYLAHDGYVETARSFAEELAVEEEALSRGEGSLGDAPTEDIDAMNRQSIRSALLEGDVDKALELTNNSYPKVLRENENIYFQLKRRKFIEMIKKLTELQNSTQKTASSTNGHPNDYVGVFDHQMELDEQLNVKNGTNEWDRMDTEDGDNTSKITRLTTEVIQYGQDLKSEFAKDPRREVSKELNTAFALMAYRDPKDSPLGHMLNDEERVVVAEELNSAILVSLGKSSSAALERLCQQTEVLIGELSEDGGSGAFINVRKDYLRS